MQGERAELQAAVEGLIADSSASIRASTILVVSRIVRDEWTVGLARLMLADPSIEVRDNAITALEAVGNDAAYAALREHKESVSWLAEYVRSLVAAYDRDD